MIDKRTTIEVITITKINSQLEINKIEPNKYDSKLLAEVYEDKIPAIPTPIDKTTTTPISENLENFFLNNSIIKQETIQAIIEIRRGLNPAAKPIATPAKEVCAKASPEEDNLL